MKWNLFIFFLFSLTFAFTQKTIVYGVVTEEDSNVPVPFASVFFKDTKTGTETDLNGAFRMESYYVSDSLVVRASGLEGQTKVVKIDKEQEINFSLGPIIQLKDEMTFYAPDEKPSTTLLKKVIKNKPINDREKLEAYEYEIYNKIQFDLNNISDKFKDRKIVKRLDVLTKYMDSINGESYLPFILSESISDFYFLKYPRSRKEVMKASRIDGLEQADISDFTGELYLDINVYDNYIEIFDKSFISPISTIALSFYNYRIVDTVIIDKELCYKMTFAPRRSGNLTFGGEIWIHDTTYAVKKWTADMSEGININYVNGIHIEQQFKQVEPEVWMMVLDKLIVDLKVTKKSRLFGLFGRKTSSRRNFVINKPHPLEFYNAGSNVVLLDSAKLRSNHYWEKHRHDTLNAQESGIREMIDSLNHNAMYKFLKGVSFASYTFFYPLGKIEIGNISKLIGYNAVEGWRNALEIRTSNNFSKRLMIYGKIAYGYRDKQLKYGGGIKYNITPKMRGMLNVYYDKDVVQLGANSDVVSIANVDGVLSAFMRTTPMSQLTLIERFGVHLEKDVAKNLIVTVSGEWRNVSRLGTTEFRTPIGKGKYDNIKSIRTFETGIKIRYAYKEGFAKGTFDRLSLGTPYPIITLSGLFGIKGILNSGYNYQKVELDVEQRVRVGILGKLIYHVYGGGYFGNAPFPFLKVHEGSRTYWLQMFVYNKMDYFEFISDKYVGAQVEHHFKGLILDRVPLINKLEWRLVVGANATWGTISKRNKDIMSLPKNTIAFGKVPYVETTFGIENIFKIIRVDLVWRMTHLEPGIRPLGVRGRFTIRF